jgi:hypothetical protein
MRLLLRPLKSSAIIDLSHVNGQIELQTIRPQFQMRDSRVIFCSQSAGLDPSYFKAMLRATVVENDIRFSNSLFFRDRIPAADSIDQAAKAYTDQDYHRGKST